MPTSINDAGIITFILENLFPDCNQEARTVDYYFGSNTKREISPDCFLASSRIPFRKYLLQMV
jgi:hypothetical protein